MTAVTDRTDRIETVEIPPLCLEGTLGMPASPTGVVLFAHGSGSSRPIVGGRDIEVLALNRTAQRSLRGESVLKIVPRATHLFEEPGTLDAVVELARDWFLAHMIAPARR